MSDESNSSPRDLPPSLPTTSEFPTNLPSAKEDTKVQLDRESSWNDSILSKLEKSLRGKYYAGKEEYLEKSEYPRQEEYLEAEEYLVEDDYLKDEQYLQEDEYSEKEEYLEEDEYLEEEKYLKLKEYIFKGENRRFEKYLRQEFKAAYSSLILSRLNAGSPIASTSQAASGFGVPRTITISADSEHTESSHHLTSIKHQASQTKWVYKSKTVSLKPELKPDGETLEQSMTSNSEVNIASELQPEGLDTWNSIDEAMDKELGDFGEHFFRRSYQAMFKRMIKEMPSANELEEDLNIPLTQLLEIENRKKLGKLLKANFEAFEDPILWLMKRHEELKPTATTTFSFRLSTLSSSKEPKPGGKKRVPGKKNVELDTEWIQETKVHNGDGKLILYPNENIFQVLFPDGTGQIYYPSGSLALLISCTGGENFTYIILEDSKVAWVRGLINNSGHATFYDANELIWLSLSSSLGYYFPKGKDQKAWNWWNLQVHVHMPPFQSISLKINSYIQVQIRSQDEIIFRFLHEEKQFRLNLGTKFKFISAEVLHDMKKKTILEVDPGTIAQKAQILLGKMNRILTLLTISDLENFRKDSEMFLMVLSTKNI